jgi:hypothetical protein
MKTSPNEGGCWFCYDDEGEMYFSVEFDCYYHLNCLRKARQDDPNNPEANTTQSTTRRVTIMTVSELACFTHTGIKVKDGGTGKVLCYRYRSDKHEKLANRQILSIWAEIDVSNGGFDSFARPTICVYVEHKESDDHE